MKKVLALVLASVMVLSLAACGAAAQATPEQKEAASEAVSAAAEAVKEVVEEKAAEAAPAAEEAPAEAGAFDPTGLKVGYIIYSNANETAREFYEGIEKQCNDHGIEVLLAESNGDEATMMSACDNFILQGVSAIIDSSWNAAGGQALVQKCNEAGIPLISIDVFYEGPNSYFVGVDNPGVGAMSGDAAAKWAGKKFGEGNLDYVVVSNTASLETINTRTTNALEGVRKAGFDIPDDHFFLLEIGSGDTTQLAKQQMTDWLTAHPDGKMVCVAGNSEGTLGFVSAIEAQNRGEDCIAVSHGLDTPAKTAISNGDPVWTAAIDYMNLHYGDTCYPLLEKLLAGERPEETHWYVQTRFVDADNYDEVVNE